MMENEGKILVTGHRGFIGSHLWKALAGHDLVGVDLKEGRDIRDLEPRDFDGVHTVFHLAAQAKVPLSVERPLFTHDHNVNGTLNVLWCAKEAGVKKVVYSASSSAYGEQVEMPLHEGMVPHPMSPYGVQKLVGEYYAKVFAELYGLQSISLRYFNEYGEGMPTDNAYSAAIAVFLEKKRKGETLTVFGGEQKRDFTYVGDVVRANLLAAKAETRGEVVNVGSGRNHSIDEIAYAISENVEHLPQRKGEPMETLADVSLAKKLLGWEPTMDVIDWLKTQ